MATLYGVLALGGGPLMSRETLALGRRTIAEGFDEVHGAPRRNGIGYQLQTELRTLGPPDSAFGHSGAGGSAHGAWPEHRIGFSYAMNLMHDSAAGDQRALNLLSALHEAASAREMRAASA